MMGRGGAARSQTVMETNFRVSLDYGTTQVPTCPERQKLQGPLPALENEAAQPAINKWLTLVIAVSVGLVAGSLYGFGRYSRDLRETLNISQTTVQRFGIMLDSGNYFGHPLTGWVYDRFGPRKSCLAASLIVFVSFGSIHLGLLSAPIWMIDLGFLGVGFGSGLGYIAGLGSTTSAFASTPHLGRAVAMVSAGYGLSSTIVGLTYRYTGIAYFFLLWAFLVAMVNIVGAFVFAQGGDSPSRRQTATTSLYQLQVVDFGRANDDTKNSSDSTSTATNERNVNESFKDITTTLMICAKLPYVQGEDEDYKLKQARALVIYHLRKYAAALNCTLCFVQPPKTKKESQDAVDNNKNNNDPNANSNATTLSSMQPTVDYHTVSEWWRALALDEKIWESTSSSSLSLSKSLSLSSSKDAEEEETKKDKENEDEATPSPETVEVATLLYGPGKHQEDLIETVVLRSATYPGHWDANKDSLWMALPSPKDEKPTETAKVTGDRGWLSQLRESIASAQDLQPAIASPEKQPEDDKKKDGKDADVSDFFASLLKKP